MKSKVKNEKGLSARACTLIVLAITRMMDEYTALSCEYSYKAAEATKAAPVDADAIKEKADSAAVMLAAYSDARNEFLAFFNGGED